MAAVLFGIALAGAGLGGWLIGPGSSDTDDLSFLAGVLLGCGAMPWTIAAISLMGYERKRRDLAVAVAAAPLEDTALAGPAPPPLAAAPPMRAHLVDGIHRPLRKGRIVVVVAIGSTLVVGGAVVLRAEQPLVGVIAAAIGALLLSFLASTIVVGRREGAMWHAAPSAAWPKDSGTAEVTGVWHEGRLGSMDVCVLDLRVYVSGASWEVRIRQEVPERWRSTVAAGTRLAVRADPADQHRVAVDWQASTHPTDGW